MAIAGIVLLIALIIKTKKEESQKSSKEIQQNILHENQQGNNTENYVSLAIQLISLASRNKDKLRQFNLDEREAKSQLEEATALLKTKKQNNIKKAVGIIGYWEGYIIPASI